MNESESQHLRPIDILKIQKGDPDRMILSCSELGSVATNDPKPLPHLIHALLRESVSEFEHAAAALDWTYPAIAQKMQEAASALEANSAFFYDPTIEEARIGIAAAMGKCMGALSALVDGK